MEIPVIALPAILALVLKISLFWYATSSTIKNAETRIYLYFLFALSIQNLVEVFGFYSIYRSVYLSDLYGLIYFSASIFAIAVLLHLVMKLTVAGRDVRNGLLLSIYGPALLLQFLLWFTPLLVRGFHPIAYSYGQVPGPYYSLFEWFTVGYLLAVFVLLIRAARMAQAPSLRVRSGILLFGLSPILVVVPVIILLQHFGIHTINSTVTLPVAVTFFLAVTAYATHQHRLFDIQFYIPWSKVRQRKTAFYDRIRNMISEIADLGSVDVAVRRIAEVLQCPVALVGDSRSALAVFAASNVRIDMPMHALRYVDRIVVRNEIAEAMPDLHVLMQQRGVAAIVPFHPHSRYASGWLLLGDAFSEQVYTSRDFNEVEKLFDRMADLFLDKLVAMRTQLADALNRVNALELRQQQMQGETQLLQKEKSELEMLVGLLRPQQPADSLAGKPDAIITATHARLTLIGRDKGASRALRAAFPQMAHYASVTSTGFRQRPAPDVLICQLEEESASQAKALSRYLMQADIKAATLIYGAGALSFVTENWRLLTGRIVEVLPDGASEAYVVRRIEALSALANSVFSLSQPDSPLLGSSPAFLEYMQLVNRVASLAEPLLVRATDTEAACALAQYIHEESGCDGAFRVLVPTQIEDLVDNGDLRPVIRSIVASVRDGTLVVPDIEALPGKFATALFELANKAIDIRLIAICAATTEHPEKLLAPVDPIVLDMPALRQRRQDLALFAHYYTLQFNLKTHEQYYLTQADFDELIENDYPETLRALRHSLHEKLAAGGMTQRDPVNFLSTPPVAGSQDGNTDKTLEQHVADFEARIIMETLKRCDGNKSRAARMLGLRPNTLHYKLERYGIGK